VAKRVFLIESEPFRSSVVGILTARFKTEKHCIFCVVIMYFFRVIPTALWCVRVRVRAASSRLTTFRLTTNRSYDQTVLKRVSIQTAVNMSLKSRFERHFKLCTQSIDSHNENSVFIILQQKCYLIGMLLGLLEGVYSTSFRFFDLQPGVQNISFS
jgi:hypothetical protein